MNENLAYVLGMVYGNGEVQRSSESTTITVEIPYKNLRTDDGKDVEVYVKASILDILSILKSVIENKDGIRTSSGKHSTLISITEKNESSLVKGLNTYIDSGNRQQNMKLSSGVFELTKINRKSLLRGVADVTAYIRRSNHYFEDFEHRVYIEIPQNWDMVVDVANLLKSVDVPIQTIDFGHPNFRDGNLVRYNKGLKSFWKKEHQIKIWANEFLPIGFNISHKQSALEKYSAELLEFKDPKETHKFYWEKSIRRRQRPSHPGENDPDLPSSIRGKHYESWQDLAKDLGYNE